MLKIAILEDEPQYAEQIQECLERFQKEYKIPIEYICFESGDTFLHNYKCQFDLLLLDIQMPFINGMSVAQEVRKTDKKKNKYETVTGRAC
nr:response regulator [uncultured Schaedlerella sp.]